MVTSSNGMNRDWVIVVVVVSDWWWWWWWVVVVLQSTNFGERCKSSTLAIQGERWIQGSWYG